MALTSVTFTADLSDAIALSGVVKFKFDDIPQGGSVEFLEERGDADYDRIGEDWAVIPQGVTSRLFELVGNYKVQRSHSAIAVSYEEV